MKETILITGANGHLGRATIGFLLNFPDPTLEKLLGRKLTGLKEFLKATYFNQ